MCLRSAIHLVCWGWFFLSLCFFCGCVWDINLLPTRSGRLRANILINVYYYMFCSFDCGIFLIKFMELYGSGCKLVDLFSQQDIPSIRVQIVNKLVFSKHNTADINAVKDLIAQVSFLFILFSWCNYLILQYLLVSFAVCFNFLFAGWCKSLICSHFLFFGSNSVYRGVSPVCRGK